MSIATITSKGQVTIPKDIRSTLHLDAGKKIAFRVEESTREVVLTPLNKSVDEVFGMLGRNRRHKRLSGKEMDHSIAHHFRKRHR